MPLDTVLCVDTSGSMAGRGMRELREACKTFIEGVRETAQQTNLSENVAIVEFGAEVRLVAPLSHNYRALTEAVNTLTAGGRTPMRKGLVKALEEILARGGVVTVRNGQKITPRVILMTDGVPTDEHGETPEARQAVLRQALAFGTKWKECGLPHPVPIACVGCGDCEPELLESIANSTNGMFVIVDDVTKLSTFFKRQVLLTRFALQSQSHDTIRSQEALRAFLFGLGEIVEEAELEGLFRLLIGMMVLEQLVEETQTDHNRVLAGLPPHGTRVRRGEDWKWGNQDENGPGTVVAHERPGVVRVQWDKSMRSNIYRYGAEDAHDVAVLPGGQPRVLLNDERGDGRRLKTGVEVRRGPDWQWNDQDGGAGNTGIVYNVDEEKQCVLVRWSSGTRGMYRNGKTGCYDVVITPRSAGQIPQENVVLGVQVEFRAPKPAPPDFHNVAPVAQNPPPRRQSQGRYDGAAATVPAEARGATVDELTADSFIGFGVGKHSWQWQDASGSWHLFPDKQIILLEDSHQQNKDCIMLKTEGVTYTVDLKGMTRTSLADQSQCNIRRGALSEGDRQLAEAMERSLYIK